ncbi:TPA: hypothetical protein EYP26_02655 [Candidatus Bathyarchaeota archaeon]|nr:hypothetical protein [Candidatus Bathyarchaeota archaeon]
MELAKYELGNILWRERALRGRINANEMKKLMELVKDALNLMKIFSVERYEGGRSTQPKN